MVMYNKHGLNNTNVLDLTGSFISPNRTGFNKEIVLPFEHELFFKSFFSFNTIYQLESKGHIVKFTEDLNQIAEKNKRKNSYSVNQYAKSLIEKILCTDVEDIITSCAEDNYLTINTANIPQFSRFDDGTRNLLNVLHRCGDFGPSFFNIGMYLTNSGKKKGAYIKYGENHSKLSSQMDLVYINCQERPCRVFLTKLGQEVYKLESEQFMNVVSKLSIRIPIIGWLLSEASKRRVSIEEELLQYLSKSTAIRRKTNIKTLLKLISKSSLANLSFTFKNIY